MRRLLLVAVAFVSLGASAWADGAGVAAAEFGCGYVGGFAAGVAGIPVGNLWSTEKFAGGGLYGFLLAYPAGVGLGVYGAGEIWGDDSASDWASAGAAVAASYTTVVVGYMASGFKGLLLGMLIAPALSTGAYNLVKSISDEGKPNTADRPAGPPAIYVSFAASF